METIIYQVLLHSLWQGLALAALTSLTLLLTQRAAPAVRYRLLTGLLALFATGVAVTAVCVAPQGAPFQPGAGLSAPAWSAAPVAAVHSGLAELVRSLDPYTTGIVWLWLVMVCLKSARLAAGLRIAGQMKRRHVYDAGSHWQDRVAALAGRLGIRQQVRLLQSARARMPLVMGHLKPVILMPLGLMSRLPAAEVEAILCHELAHIRRRDFLVNLLQSVLEVFFFFNPAVLWLNTLIRDEREQCCDDLALQAGGGVRDYVRALVSSHTAVPLAPAPALSFAGPRNQLLRRARRLLEQRSPRMRPPLRLALVCLLLAVSTALLSLRHGDRQARPVLSTTRIERTERTVETDATYQPSSPAPAQPDAGPVAGLYPDASQPAPEMPAEPAASEEPAAPESLADIAAEPPAFSAEEEHSLLEDLASDGLIRTGSKSLSYRLSDEELIINNVRQPKSVHRKYKTRYGKYPGRTIVYTYAYDRID